MTHSFLAVRLFSCLYFGVYKTNRIFAHDLCSDSTRVVSRKWGSAFFLYKIIRKTFVC